MRLDIHRHGEAAVTLSQLPRFIERHRINLPRTEEELMPLLQCQGRPGDLLSFLKPFDFIDRLFPTKEAIREYMHLVVEQANAEGLRYVELRFSPYYMSGIYSGAECVKPEDVVEALIEGRREAAERFPRVYTGLILIIGRELGTERAEEVVKLALKYREDVCGIDLAGNERDFPPHDFREIFNKARSEQVGITIHAGEAGPAENVRFAMLEGGATRIGHGIAVEWDREVKAIARDLGVHFEMCPISNWMTGAISGAQCDHPALRLLRDGMNVSLATDDPLVQGTGGLEAELQVAKELLGAERADLNRFGKNAIDAAFMPNGLREQYKRELGIS